MPFILSSCRDAEGYSFELFEKYKAYLESVRAWMPESCMEIATAEWWYNIEQGGPHDLQLVGMELIDRYDEELGGVCDICVRLSCGEDGLKIEYGGVLAYEMTMREDVWHSDWRYDEFSLHAPGVFCHTIEWANGQEWKLMARELKVEKFVAEVE